MFFPRKKKEIPIIEIGNYTTGHPDPASGKKIIYVCYQTKKFLVTIDSDVNVNWCAFESMEYACDFGDIVSKVNLAEALIDRIFTGKGNRIAYKKMLGDVLGRVLDDCNSATAKIILDETILRILAHSKERVRMAYIIYAIMSVFFVGILTILTLLFKEDVLYTVGNQDVFRIIACTLLGGIGAFITSFARFQNYQGNIMAGLPIHRLDGFLRVFYGLIAGLVISLAIKGKIIANFADEGQPWLLYFFAMIAGASEVLIPNLVRQAESQTSLKQQDEETKKSASQNPVAIDPLIAAVENAPGKQLKKKKGAGLVFTLVSVIALLGLLKGKQGKQGE